LEFPEIDPEHKNYNDMIDQASERLKTMINRILNINAIEHRDIVVKIERINLGELIHDAASQVSKLCHKKNINLSIKLAPGDLHARVDSGYLLQVLENLLSNAIKFSQPDKNIFIETESNHSTVKIIVRDEGPGLTEADMKLIFQKYQQLSAKPSSGEESSGLGLYLSKKYIENMNGKIWCESKSGNGASFIIELMADGK
jgi:signal transduction histidine kinase